MSQDAAIRLRLAPAFELKSQTWADKADNRDNSDYFVTMAERSEHRQQSPSAQSLTSATEALGLEALISRAARAGKGPAPVERWNPDFCGDLDMEIKADGTWF